MHRAEKMEINVEDYYLRYGPMVLRRCRQLLRDEEKALDALQEVFTKLLLHKERLKSLYPSSLLFRISTNVCLNMIRAQLKHQSGNMKDILANIALYDESEDRLIINDILERIFKKEKKINPRDCSHAFC